MNNKIISTVKSGFTLAEALITLALIGTIAAMTMPTLKGIVPDKYDALHKKADYALEHTISDLVNDQYIYGDIRKTDKVDDEFVTTVTRGLSNTNKVVVDGVSYGGKDSEINNRKKKFCLLVASKFNLDKSYGVQCDPSKTSKFLDLDGGKPDFVTRDGMQFILPKSLFEVDPEDRDNAADDQIILIKTSMPDDKKAPKCMYIPEDFYNNISKKQNLDMLLSPYGIEEGKRNGGRTLYYTKIYNQCKHPDTFIYFITPEGRLYKPEYGKFNIREMSDYTITTGN